MTDLLRPSPRHKTVSLFATCMVDTIFPHTGISTVKILDHLGIETVFPPEQICCAQPAFNAGFWDDARQIARHFIRTFKDAEVIVMPSGSCASMIRHYYPVLFNDDPVWREKAARIGSITWELTEFLVDGLGVTELGAKLPPTQIAFHQACHGLRLMHLKPQPMALAEGIEGVTVVPLPGAEECCGFGGLFAVKMPEVSAAMLKAKLENIDSIDVDMIVTGDSGCLAQINGGLSRAGKTLRVVHIADLLARGLEYAAQGQEEKAQSS